MSGHKAGNKPSVEHQNITASLLRLVTTSMYSHQSPDYKLGSVEAHHRLSQTV